jgi:hypothetical protein
MAGIKIGSAAMIEIGYEGENRTREIIFDAKEWMEKLPGCEPAIVGVRADGVEFTAPDVRKDEEEKTIIWTLTAGETIAGEGEAQILWMDGERVAKKAIMVTMCRASLETEATVPDAPEPTWGQMAIDAMQRAQAAAAKAETALGAVNGAKNEAIAAIEEADAAALEGIAYAKDKALEEIDAAAGTAAGSIMPTEAGEVIAVHDSAEKNMRAVKIYGRTTQSGTPTPSAPVPLVTVGADGDVVVFANEGFEGGNKNITIIAQPRNLIAPVGAKAVYSVVARGNGLAYQWMYSTDGGETWGKLYWDGATADVMTFDVTSIRAQNLYRCVLTDANGNVVNTDAVTLTIGAAYKVEIPATVQTATITTLDGLPGVPCTSDGNYTDVNGQQWIADTIEYDADTGAAKYVQRIVKKAFNGTESWTAGTNVFYTPIPDCLQEFTTLLSDKYVNVGSTVGMGALAENQMRQGSAKVTVCFPNIGNALTKAEWTAQLATAPIELIYPLATPIETELSEEETAQLAALKTYYPETTVYNEDSAHMEIKYVADTKNYIDKKIEAIAAAMLAKI